MIIQMERTKEARLIEAIRILAAMARPLKTKDQDNLEVLIDNDIIDFDDLPKDTEEEMREIMGYAPLRAHCNCSNCLECLGMTSKDFF